MIAALCLLIDTVAAWSSLLGGFACICPGLYAAIRLKKAVHAEEKSRTEAVKLTVSG